MSTLQTLTRRAAIGAAAACLSASPETIDEKSFRYRVQTLDSLLERVRAARHSGKITEPEYRLVVGLLAEEEDLITQEVKNFQFRDQSESNYWHRGRLKFPSAIEMELRAK